MQGKLLFANQFPLSDVGCKRPLYCVYVLYCIVLITIVAYRNQVVLDSALSSLLLITVGDRCLTTLVSAVLYTVVETV